MRAIRGRRHPRVLVLGATPELRDMAITVGAECLAVDWSFKTMAAMQGAMRHADDPRNLMMVCDWTKIAEYLDDDKFDAIMGDASFNNVPFESQTKMMRACRELLKPGGRLIFRHGVYVPGTHITYAEWQRGYNARRFHWLSVAWPLCHVMGRAYNPKTGVLKWGVAWKEYYAARRKGLARLRPDDQKKFDNVAHYGAKVIHWTMSRARFELFAKRYFTVESVIGSPEYAIPEMVGIWILKKK